jgi:hypothetical protein
MIATLTRMPILHDLQPDQLRVAAALRIWALTGRMGRCPIPVVAERLGSMSAATHFHMLLEEIGAAWPEPFCVSPPCSPRLSHDEATLTEMVAVAARGDRPAFDRLLVDLLPFDERERLFVSATALSRTLRREHIGQSGGVGPDDGLG